MATPALTQTSIGKDELKKLNSVLTSIFDNQESVEFRQPVDVKGLGLTDYLTIIKTPMDLNSVKKKILKAENTNMSKRLYQIFN